MKNNVQKVPVSTSSLYKINNYQNVYALTQVESVMLDQSNASGSRNLNQQQIIGFKEEEDEEIDESFKKYDNEEILESNSNVILYQKINDKDENHFIDQSLDFSTQVTPRQSQLMKNTSLFSNQDDFSSIQPLETSSDADFICEKQLNLFQKDGSIPDPTQQQRLIQYIQRQKVNAIITSNFKEASKLQSAYQNLMNAINKSQYVDTLKIRKEEIEKKIAETNEQIDILNDEIKSAISTERLLLDQKKEDILRNQDIELDKFEQRWNDEEFLRKFAKPSSTLMAKQSIQHSYILMKDFNRAEELKNEIESMEISESQEAQNKAESEMLKEQKKLIEKHQNELDTFNEFSKRQIDTITNRQEVKLEPLIARKRKLEAELKQIKAGQSKSALLPSILNVNQTESSKITQNSSFNTPSPSSRLCTKSPASYSRGIHSNSTLESIMTPRTVQKYSSYKSQIKNPKITLKPLGKIITKKDKKRIMSNNRPKRTFNVV